MEYLQRGLMSHDLDPGGVKPLDASVPRASGEVAGLGPSRNPSDSSFCPISATAAVATQHAVRYMAFVRVRHLTHLEHRPPTQRRGQRNSA